TGSSVGIAGITYTTPSGCVTTTTVTVNPLTPITGTLSVCQGSTTTLSDATTGGTWSSLSSSVATIDPSNGIVTGVSPGTAMIMYITSLGCSATNMVTVNPLPEEITGAAIVCSMITLSDAVPGGSWSSSNNFVAVVDAITGKVTGVSAGTVTITYTM